MDIDAVLVALEACAVMATSPPPRSFDRPRWLPTQRIEIPPDVLAALVAVLRSQPELVIFDDQMQQFGGQASRVSLEDLAYWLVSRAVTIGAKQTIDGLCVYVAEPTFPVEDTCLLAGVSLTEPVEVDDGVSLVPFERLPDSPYKTMFTPSGVGQTWPTAALTCQNFHPKSHGGGMIDLPTRHAEMMDMVLVLTLIGPSSPVILAFWSSPALWVPLSNAALTWSSPATEGSRHRTGSTLGEDDVRRFQDLYGLFKRLSAKDKAHLRIPLDRLNRALRRASSTDSAIELGIALEAVLLNDLEDDRGELTFRLRVRGSRLLGATQTDRQRIFKSLRVVYELRSRAVHSGSIPDQLDGVPSTTILEEGYRLTGNIVERIMRQGKSPDWTDVVLG